MGRGRQGGEMAWTEGAWLVTRQDDGTTTRARLLTFNPFARPGAQMASARQVTNPWRRAAWHRERVRFRRAQKNACPDGARRQGGARPPRLTSAQVRAIHELARLRAAERQGAATVARNNAGGR